jgi:hypothetical protein
VEQAVTHTPVALPAGYNPASSPHLLPQEILLPPAAQAVMQEHQEQVVQAAELI